MRVSWSKALVGAALAAAVIADNAAAQQPPTFGGGRLEQAARPKAYEPALNLSLQPRGSRIAMLFDSTVLCGRRNIVDVYGGGRVAWDGTNFSFSGRGRQELVKGVVNYRWTVTGQISGGTGTGTLRVTGVRRRRSGSVRCARKPVRAFTVKLAGVPAGGPALPAPRAFYVGTSNYVIYDSMQSPVVLRASKDGKKIGASWTTSINCNRGPTASFVNFTPPMRVRPDGTFSRKERFSVSYGTEFVRYRATFSGRMQSDGATGIFRMRTRVYDRTGRKLRTKCDSGRRIWVVNPA